MTQTMAILGAGLTGLSAAWSLATRGHKVVVFERDASVGGLAKSVSYQGFTFDIGPHRLLALQDSRVWQLVHSLLGQELQVRHRQSRILRQGTYLNYPLQAQSLFANTTVSDNLAAIGSFLRCRAHWYLQRPPDTDFARWIINRFGQVLYETHFRDYTTKLWGLPPTDISADWALERISQLTLWDMVRALVWPARHTPRTHATAFDYPRGGVGTIAQRLAQAIRQSGGTIALNTTVTGLETLDDRVVEVRWVEASSGQAGRSGVDSVISTIPLPVLASLCPHAPSLAQAIAGLRYRSLILVNVLLQCDRVSGDHWLYIPEKHYLFNRLSEPKNYSESLSPAGHTSVCAEITCDAGDALWQAETESLLARVTDSLTALKLFRPADICGGFVVREPQAYPIYTLRYRQYRQAILTHLRGFTNLYTTGRQGLFQYNNMDHAMEMGLAAADAIAINQAQPARSAAS